MELPSTIDLGALKNKVLYILLEEALKSGPSVFVDQINVIPDPWWYKRVCDHVWPTVNWTKKIYSEASDDSCIAT